MASILKAATDAFVVLGAAAPYYPQAKSMIQLNDASSFSLYTCLIIMSSATLRIFYWFGPRFGTPLLLQAFVSILTHLCLIFIIMRIKNDNRNDKFSVAQSKKPVEHSIIDFDRRYFWRWTNFESYLTAEVLFCVFLSILSFLFGSSDFFAILGTFSLSIEALLPIPTFLENRKRQSTSGLSVSMIGMWAVGDLFKAFYALSNGEPLVFILCGVVQLTVDLLILLQIFYYGKQK